MPEYEVTRAWHGVEVGHRFEADRVSPALASHVRELKNAAEADFDATGNSGSKLTPATPSAATGKKPNKGEVIKRLKELGIEFDGRKSAEELLTLLPDDDSPKAEPEQAA